MPLKIVYPHRQEIVGSGLVLLTSPPADLASDSITRNLVEEAALVSKSHALIAQEAKVMDESKFQLLRSEFFASARTILKDQGIKCIVEVTSRKEPGIEIQSEHESSTQSDALELMSAGLAESFDVTTTLDGRNERGAYGQNGEVQVIRIFLGPEERSLRKDLVVERVAYAVRLINGRLGYSETNKRPGDALD